MEKIRNFRRLGRGVSLRAKYLKETTKLNWNCCTRRIGGGRLEKILPSAMNVFWNYTFWNSLLKVTCSLDVLYSHGN